MNLNLICHPDCKKCLKEKRLEDHKDFSHRRLVHAINELDEDLIVHFLRKGFVDFKHTAKNGDTLLHHYIRANGRNFILIHLFIMQGANVIKENLNKETPLVVAIRRQASLRVIKELIPKDQKGINLQSQDGQTALHVAVRQCYKSMRYHYSIIDLLIRYKIDTQIKDNYGHTALSLAIRMKRPPELIELLIKNGCQTKDLIERGNSLLHIASGLASNIRFHSSDSCIDVELMKILIKYGVDTNKRNDDGLTPLHMLFKCTNCTSEILDDATKLLISGKADVNLRTIENETTLIYALRNRKTTKSIIKTIVEKMSSINGDEIKEALILKRCDVIEILLNHEIIVGLPDNILNLALHYQGMEKYSLKFSINLVENFNCDVNYIDSKYGTPLNILIKQINEHQQDYIRYEEVENLTNVLDYLIALDNLDVNAQSSSITPLNLSFKYGLFSISEKLLSLFPKISDCNLIRMKKKPGFALSFMYLYQLGFNFTEIMIYDFNDVGDEAFLAEFDQFVTWLENEKKQIHNLAYSAGAKIRTVLGPQTKRFINDLDLPHELRDFILLKNILPPKSEIIYLNNY